MHEEKYVSMEKVSSVRLNDGGKSPSGTLLGANRKVQLSKRRWLLLGIFVVQEILLSFQCSQLSIINNVIVHYYDTSATLVEWTTLVYSLSNLIFALPCAHLLNKIGARYMVILAGTIGCAGAWMKLLSVQPDRLYLLMAGQVLESTSFSICYGMISLIPAVWFGSKEISLAGTLSVTSTAIGSALGFLLTPRLVQDDADFTSIGAGMMRMHFSVAVAWTVVLIVVIAFFKSKPKYPASIAQALQNDMQFGGFLEVWRRLASNPGFVRVAPVYASCIFIFNLNVAVLNELVLAHFPDSSMDAGNIGFLSVMLGVLCSLLSGHLLDKTGQFKKTAIVQVTAACIAAALTALSFKWQNIVFVYISTVLLTMCLMSCLSTTIQICLEVTYPTPENIAVTTMFLLGDLYSIVLTSVYSFGAKQYGYFVPNIGLVVLLLTSVILACSIPSQFERQHAEKTGMLSPIQ